MNTCKKCSRAVMYKRKRYFTCLGHRYYTIHPEKYKQLLAWRKFDAIQTQAIGDMLRSGRSTFKIKY